MPQEAKTYSQDEAEAILRIAVRQPALDSVELASVDAIGYTKLEQIALELGISSEALASAENEFILQKAAEESQCEQIQIRKLFLHSRKVSCLKDVVAYGLLSLISIVFYFAVTPFMFFWPSLLLVGSVIRLAPTLAGFLSKPVAEKQYLAWTTQNWGAAMYGTDYWRHRAGGHDPAASMNPNADYPLYLELRMANKEFLKKAADSGSPQSWRR